MTQPEASNDAVPASNSALTSTIPTPLHPSKAHTLFLSNLPTIHLTNRQIGSAIYDTFKVYNLRKYKIVKTAQNKAVGVAYLTFFTAEEAHTVLQQQQQCAFTVLEQSVQLTYITDKRDLIFPLLSYDQRLRMQIDGIGLYSITDQLTALRISELLHKLVHAVECDDAGTVDNVIDLTACCGGQSFALTEHFKHVTAVELDAGRAKLLQHNAAVYGVDAEKFDVLCTDSTTLFPFTSKQISPTPNIILVDPPWDGPDYSSKAVLSVDDIRLGSMTMADILHQCRYHSEASMVVISLPFNYDVQSLAASVVTPSATTHDGSKSELDERPLPFLFNWVRRLLLVVCMPHQIESESTASEQTTTAPRYRNSHYSNATLDTVINCAKQFNTLYSNVYKPSFYDYEAQRFISLSHWKGVKLRNDEQRER